MRIEFEGTMEEFHALFFTGNGVSRTITTAPAVIEIPSVAQVSTAEAPELGEVGPATTDTIPVPADYRDGATAQVNGELPTLRPELREEAMAYFAEFCGQWVQGFDEQDEEGNPVPQPDRVDLMSRLGRSRYAHSILVMCYEKKSLQRLVEEALNRVDPSLAGKHGEGWLDWIQAVSALLVNVSHVGFPELDGALDYSSKWRREER
jgi:hypothetical protein